MLLTFNKHNYNRNISRNIHIMLFSVHQGFIWCTKRALFHMHHQFKNKTMELCCKQVMGWFPKVFFVHKMKLIYKKKKKGFVCIVLTICYIQIHTISKQPYIVIYNISTITINKMRSANKPTYIGTLIQCAVAYLFFFLAVFPIIPATSRKKVVQVLQSMCVGFFNELQIHNSGLKVFNAPPSPPPKETELIDFKHQWKPTFSAGIKTMNFGTEARHTTPVQPTVAPMLISEERKINISKTIPLVLLT